MRQEALDLNTLDKTRSIMGEKFGVFVRMYQEHVREYMSVLASVAEGDRPVPDAVIPAHSLNSSSRQLGLADVGMWAEKAELQAANGEERATLAAAIGELELALREVEPLLQSWAGGEGGEQPEAARWRG